MSSKSSESNEKLATSPELLHDRIEKLKSKDMRHLSSGHSDNIVRMDKTSREIIKTFEEVVEELRGYQEAEDQEDYPYVGGCEFVETHLRVLEELTDAVREANRTLANTPMLNAKLIEQSQSIDLLNKNVSAGYFSYRLRTELSRIFRSNDVIEGDWKRCQILVEKVTEEADKAIEAISGERAKVAVAKSQAVFDKLEKHHRDHEESWATFSKWAAFVVAAVAIALVFFPNIVSSASVSGHWSEPLLRRGILLSLPLIALRIGLQRYNVERHMRTTYEHHRTIMEQFETIQELLAKDQESKEGFRMEVARTILALPSSGYLDSGRSAGDLNIGSIVGSPERLIRNPTPN